MKQKRTIAFLIFALFAAALFFCGSAAASDAAAADVSAADYSEGQTEYVSELFQTHMPLIILEAPDLDIADGAQESTPASMHAVDSGADNRPDGERCFSEDVLLDAIRYENDDPRPKKDYFISLADGGDGSTRVPLQGFEPGNRWFLLGGAYDKSLIRNYLGYTLAKRIRSDAPAVRLCELLLKTGAGYEYQGVYLLVEGNSMDGMVTARRTEHYWEGFNQTVVNNGDAGVFVLQKNWGDGSEITSMGSAIETVINMFKSSDTDQFLKYSEIIDTESFYAYFLINELMANYEGMSESIYTYNQQTQKISIGPLWNFERALDNQKNESMDLRRLKYQSAPFYQHMIIDSEFVNGLINISKKNTVAISGAEIRHIIESAVTQIGEAQQRDWHRWQSFYLSEENALSSYSPSGPDALIDATGLGYSEQGALMVETKAYFNLPENAPERARQFQAYEQEIIKLKFYAYERPSFVRKAILLYKNQDELLTQVNAYGQNSIWAVLFLVCFLLTIILARRTAGR